MDFAVSAAEFCAAVAESWARAVATRDDRLAVRYESTVLVAVLNEWR
ncbi:hypothetical protein [Streptomyces nigrescens]